MESLTSTLLERAGDKQRDAECWEEAEKAPIISEKVLKIIFEKDREYNIVHSMYMRQKIELKSKPAETEMIQRTNPPEEEKK